MSAAVSFQNKLKHKFVRIRGTKPSIHNSMLITSSGVPTIDAVVGGGFAVGTVVLLEEDVFGNFSTMLLKHFLAEGVESGHGIFLAGDHCRMDSMIKTLPKLIASKNPEDLHQNLDKRNLNIAWRYQHLPNLQSAVPVSAADNEFDVNKYMSEDMVAKSNPVLFNVTCTKEEFPLLSLKGDSDQVFVDLLQNLKNLIKKYNFSPNSLVKGCTPNVLRIGLHSLGSPYWPNVNVSVLIKFIYQLRAIARETFVVFMITLPYHLVQETCSIEGLHRACDTVLNLESFQGSLETINPLYKDYHGLFHIKKLPKLNSLVGLPYPSTTIFGFYLRRKKLVVQMLHLPPELPETRGNTHEEANSQRTQTSSCSNSGPKLLDF